MTEKASRTTTLQKTFPTAFCIFKNSCWKRRAVFEPIRYFFCTEQGVMGNFWLQTPFTQQITAWQTAERLIQLPVGRQVWNNNCGTEVTPGICTRRNQSHRVGVRTTARRRRTSFQTHPRCKTAGTRAILQPTDEANVDSRRAAAVSFSGMFSRRTCGHKRNKSSHSNKPS